MGCCGCTLYGSTVTAGVLTLLDCVLFLTFDVLVIVFLSVHDHWIIKDPDFSSFVHGFKDFPDSTTIIILIGIKVGLRIVWCISAVLLLIGNAREYRKFINVWKYLTISRIVYNIATSIYALVSLVAKINDLFKSNTKWKDNPDGMVSKFVVLMNFLELGPIWLIILIALAIYVHQRSQEIETKKSQPNHWGNFGSNHPNGSARNGTSNMAHPVSLTQEPNPFTITSENNNAVHPETNYNQQPNGAPRPGTTPKPSVLNHNGVPNPTAPGEPLKPILEINGVISIPRVTLSPTKTSPTKFDSHHDNKRYVSSLAKRSSYFEYERDPNKVPKRNHSYNLAQTSGQKSHNTNAYDNRAFDRKTENDLYKPVLIKRASTRRSHNQ